MMLQQKNHQSPSPRAATVAIVVLVAIALLSTLSISHAELSASSFKTVQKQQQSPHISQIQVAHIESLSRNDRGQAELNPFHRHESVSSSKSNAPNAGGPRIERHRAFSTQDRSFIPSKTDVTLKANEVLRWGPVTPGKQTLRYKIESFDFFHVIFDVGAVPIDFSSPSTDLVTAVTTTDGSPIGAMNTNLASLSTVALELKTEAQLLIWSADLSKEISLEVDVQYTSEDQVESKNLTVEEFFSNGIGAVVAGVLVLTLCLGMYSALCRKEDRYD